MSRIEVYAADAVAAPSTAPAQRRPWYTLALLILVGIVNLTDRQILSIFIVPIQSEFHVSDSQMGFLTGFGFSLFYVAAGLPIARWLDRGNRRNILAYCLAGWSLATGLCGLAISYTTLLLTRIGVAVGEAAANPGVIAIATDSFPPSQRARVVSAYYVGNSLGVFVGLAAGGWLAATVGWRYAFLFVAIPGLLLALALRFTMAEPARGQFEAVAAADAEMPSLLQTLQQLFRVRTYQWLVVSSIFYAVITYGLMAWSATFLIRVHNMTSAAVGLKLGAVSGIGLVIGNLLGGFTADIAAKRSVRWYLLVPAIANLSALPFVVWFFFTDSAAQALLVYMPMMCLLGSSSAALVAAAMSVCDPRARATGYSAYYLSSIVIGMGAGPFVIGVLNDFFAASYGVVAIRYSLALVIVVGVICAVAALLAGSRSIVADQAHMQNFLRGDSHD